MNVETSRWDTADHLASSEAKSAYLEAVFEDGDPALIAAALNDVARAKYRGHGE
jgi:probable addiction module antidote protein